LFLWSSLLTLISFPIPSLLSSFLFLHSFFSVYASRLSETDDQYLPGLTAAIVGLKRGDRVLLGIPPSTLATKIVTKPLMESSKKKHPLGYLVVMLEINKIKSSEKKSKDSSAATAPATTVVPFGTAAAVPHYSDDHVVQSNTIANTNTGSTPDLSSRMAKLSGASSSNAGQLANIMNPKAKSVSFTETNQIHHIEPIGATASSSSLPDNSIPSSVSVTAPLTATPVKLPQVQPQQQQSPQVQQQQQPQQQAPIQQVQHQQQQQQQPQVVQPTIQHQPQQLQQSQPMSATNTTQNQQQNQNNGFSSSVSTNNSNFSNNSNNSNSGGDYGGSVSSNQLASSMMIIQQSLMSLHTKLDQVNMTVNNCSSLTQQSSQSLSLLPSLSQQLSMAVQSLSSSVSSSSPGGASPNQQSMMMGGGGGGGGNMMGMGMNPMNMNPMMGYPPNPMMMMNPYQMYGMMNSPVQMASSPLPGSSSSTVCSNPQIKVKNDEINSNLQFILSQYELLKNENNDLKNKLTVSTIANDNTEKIKNLESKVLSLEEKSKNLEVSRSLFHCLSYGFYMIVVVFFC
jgi:hypothetical protein